MLNLAKSFLVKRIRYQLDHYVRSLDKISKLWSHYPSPLIAYLVGLLRAVAVALGTAVEGAGDVGQGWLVLGTHPEKIYNIYI